MSKRHLIVSIPALLVGLAVGFIYFYQVLGRPADTGQTYQQQIALPTNSAEATFLAVGDIMLTRGVAGIINRTNDPLLPFKGMAKILKSTDFNFGNLESPFSGRDKVTESKSLIFNTPVRNVKGLKEYNFKVLNLANNHALDQGVAGLRYTRELLAGQGLAYLGVGESLDEAWRPHLIEVNGIKIGFIGASYASVNDGGVTRNEYVARIEDTVYLQGAVARLKSQADFVVVTMHAGIEYTREPEPAQIAFGRAAVDYGADLVIGAHPHWVQTIEKYRDKYIFYSLGNFIFDQGHTRDTSEGLALKVILRGAETGAHLDRIELVPVVIERYSTPRVATPAEAERILGKIGVSETVLKP